MRTGPAVVALAAALALAGCGKKPKFVDPPQGRAADTFPQTYPNPSTLPPSTLPPSSEPSPAEVAPGIRFP